MAGWAWWLIIGFGLLIAELLTGTFYLLVIAIAFAAAAAAEYLGASFTWQLLIAAAIGVGGSLWLRQSGIGRRRRGDADRLQHLDVGQTIRIDQWSAGRTARASYRGAQWDVELAAGEAALPGDFEIRAVQGSRLIVGARK